MKVILKTVDIDNIYYNNNFQNYPTNDTINIKGYANQYRTKIIYKNINLPSILGSKKFSKNKTFNIKILDIIILNENGNTNPIDVINSQSLGIYRTSNIFMYSDRLIPINGVKEILITQLTNFNTNEEFIIENCVFHRGDQGNYQHLIRSDSRGAIEFFNNFNFFVNIPFMTYSFYYKNIDNVLNNKRVQVNSTAFANNMHYLNITSIDNDIPAIISTTVNRPFDMYIIPNSTGWTNRKRTDNFLNDSICEYTFWMPEDYNIDLTFEIRDLLTNQLQPILGNNIYFPSISIVLDIY